MTNKMENEMDEKNSFDRIKALESEVAELKRDRDEWKDSTISANRRFEIAENDVYKYQVETANMSLKIFELESKLKIAVDSLKDIKRYGDCELCGKESESALKQIEVK